MASPAERGPSGTGHDTRGKDRTPWPHELMHTELCAWRFGGKCDCDRGKEQPVFKATLEDHFAEELRRAR